MIQEPYRSRFLAKFAISTPDECWRWAGAHTSVGYGCMDRRAGQTLAHRISYELFVGPIPEGLQLDHLCRVRDCVNPNHLEPVTHRENSLRGTGIAAQNARRTVCQRGHEYIGDNLYWVDPTRPGLPPKRGCKECARIRWRRAYLVKKSKLEAAAPWPTPDDITEDVA